MLVTAVAAWLLVSTSFWTGAARTLGAGDLLGGVGQLFVGLAAAVAAIASWLNGRKAKDSSAEAAKALGAANGTTVLALLHEIKGFEEYQHGRNHDLLNAIARLEVATPLLIQTLERLIGRLDETEKK